MVCAWAGCASTFEVAPDVGGMPEGWVWLVTFWSREPLGCIDPMRHKLQRDASLCPEHALALEARLKVI